MSLRVAAQAVFRREITLFARRRSDWANPLMFFLIVTSIFPFAVGSESERLRLIGIGVLFVGALLAAMLALPRLFDEDAKDGSLEHLLTSPEPLAVLILARVAAISLALALPLALATPAFALFYALPSEVASILALTVVLAVPTLILIGAIASALLVAARGGAILTAVLVLPLTIPTLIFGAGAALKVLSGESPAAELALQAAYFLFALALCPLAAAAALRISTD
ncbi:MAG: heme exporter protein CcmB [Burkholderiales bacterium]|nr:MAG: heme exporter protein CcmB [Burkholderiales bacterium]TAG83210.1 MAG: heme exporter protein CcmB [Betaproteobacteria bacterium]